MTTEQWKAVHSRLKGARAIYLRGTQGQLWGRPTDGVESKYLLTGMARCGACGGSLVVRSRSHRGRRAFFYGCTSNHHRGRSVCTNTLEMPMAAADEAVLSQLEGDALRPRGLAASLTVSGTLLYVTGERDSDRRTLVLVDRDGQQVPAPGLPSALYWDVRVSPDSNQVAVSVGTPSDILTYDIGRETTNLVTTDSANDWWPLWTTDGEYIVFQSDRGGRSGLYLKRADGTGVAELVFAADDSSTGAL